MLTLRPSGERGRADHGWLRSFHSFSFADYFDPAHMGFRALRVINEDVVQPGTGFPTHGHRDMEILTWILAGALEHKDSLGTGSVIRPGEIQHMSAGRGVRHSEFNPSAEQPVHLLQIWIEPAKRGAEPRYGQRDFGPRLAQGGLVLLASPDGDAGSLPIGQDARLFVARTRGSQAERHRHELAPGRAAWLQVVRGELAIGEQTLAAGDGAAIEDQPQLELVASPDAEFLLFDLP